MNIKRLGIKNLGPIRSADLALGDLTVFVGPQASGKSIALQTLRLIVDHRPIRARLGEYGIDWSGHTAAFLDSYLGEGMHSLVCRETKIEADQKAFDLDLLRRRVSESKPPEFFFIPAQRVLTLRDGWPRPFGDYRPGDPFSVRDFSEELRRLIEGDLGKTENLFPKPSRLKTELRKALDDAVFRGFSLKIDRFGSQKRLVLEPGDAAPDASPALPYMVWSAGQREFVPLLLGLFWLMPGAKVSRRGEIKWVVIEELEMGLHPKAVNAVLLVVLELLWRGYRVCLSTHSPQVLDLLWALRVFREHGGTVPDVLDLFECGKTDPMKRVAKAALSLDVRIHYFQQNGESRDISQLDPGSDDQAQAGWGGLTEFSGRVGEIVARVASRSLRGEE